MVRSLTSTLRTALGATSQRPALSAIAQDTILHFASYQTPGTSDGFSDACIAGDNSIIRVRLSRGQMTFSQTFYWQRITDPSQASQWANWTAFSGGSNNMFQDGHCAVSYNALSNTLRAFAQQGTGGSALWNWFSTNNGASWSSAPDIVCTPPTSALLKGIASVGNNDVFFIYDVIGGDAVGACFYTGSWSSINTWTLPTLTFGAGLAVLLNNNIYNIVYSDGFSLKTCTYTPSSSTWASGITIAPATTTSLLRLSPRLMYDSTGLSGAGLFSLTCIEADAGIITGSVYQYARIRQSMDFIHWSNGFIAHDLNKGYAVNMFRTTPASGNAGIQYYLATLATIEASPSFSPNNPLQYLDVSTSVLRYTRQEAARKAGKLDLWLDNNKGQYNAQVAQTTYYYGLPIGLNTSIVLQEGYYTGTPPTTKEVISTGIYHLNRIEFVRSPEENALHLIGYDLSRRLDFVSRYQLTWSNQSIAWLIAEVCVRASLFQLALPTTPQMSQVVPTFTLHAGQKYRAALDELCDTYGLDYFLDQFEVLQFRELNSGDTPAWSYQPEIELVSFGSDDLRANHIIVSGKPPIGGQIGALTTAEAYDDTNMHVVGDERVLHATDTKLTTTTQCALKAAFLMAQEQRAMTAHVVTVPANPALQLLDPVTLTDSTAPTGSGQVGTARIIAQAVHFDAQHAKYEQQLKLEGM